MLSNVLSLILNAGIGSGTPAYLVTNLRAAAIVNLILFAVATAFFILFIFIAPGVIPLVLSVQVALLTSMACQMFGYHIIGRIITSISVCIAALTLHNIAASQAGSLLYGLYAACTLLALAPWFLFSISEYGYATTAFIINALAVLLSPMYLEAFSVSIDVSAISHPVLQTTTMVAGLLILSASTIALQSINRKEAIKARDLLKKIEKENIAANEKEAQLNTLVSELQKAQNEEKKRIWSSNGIAEAAKIMRDAKDINEMTDRLISFLVKYIGCNQGAVFLIEQHDDESYFQLKGCYAYDRKKFIDKRISVGEGLLGECYFEKNFIHLRQVPKDYTHITSGLGHATPRNILIVPLLLNDVVYGAIELASFKEFNEHEVSFAMEVAENTASTVHSIRINDHTRMLLTETQTMAEQMKAQEEAMRQNMEELAASQEQQMRIEQELRQQLEQKQEEIELLRQHTSLITIHQ